MYTPPLLLRAAAALTASTLVAASLATSGGSDQRVRPTAGADLSSHSRTVAAPAITLVDSVTPLGSAQQVGIADAYLYTLDQPQLVEQLNEIRSLGVTDVRLVVPWAFVQPTSSSSYDWSRMDNVINTAHAMGFNIAASITINPAWDGAPMLGTPNVNAYTTFASAVAQRYGNKIAAYEVWNEPNSIAYYAPVDPASYTALLKATYTAIKAVQPDATVIAGVLGAVNTVPGMSLAPDQFLAQMYADGAHGYFDAVSFHPYNYTLPFSAGAGVANSPLEVVKSLYALMTANGDAQEKIWATEFGTPTGPGGVSETQQAQMLQDFVTAWSKLPFVGPAFVYTANDQNTGYLLDENNLGLFTTDGVPKLAAQTLATLISQLAIGTVPNYTAPQMSAAQATWIQVVSLAISVANQVLLVPNLATQTLYNALPAPLQQVFATVSAMISRTAGAALTAVTPLAVGTLDAVFNAGPNLQHAAAAINSAVQNAVLAVGTAAHNTELTLAAAAQKPAAAAASPTITAAAAAPVTAPVALPTGAQAAPANAARSSTKTTTATTFTSSPPPAATATSSVTAPILATGSIKTAIGTSPATTSPAAPATTGVARPTAAAPVTTHDPELAAQASNAAGPPATAAGRADAARPRTPHTDEHSGAKDTRPTAVMTNAATTSGSHHEAEHQDSSAATHTAKAEH